MTRLRRLISGPEVGASFEEAVLPHLDAAYRLARWLLRNKHDAEDAVQEASLKALRYFRTFEGVNGRAWFLRIVRNTCYGRQDSRLRTPADQFDEELHSSVQSITDPETLLIHTADVALIERTMRTLPDHFREVLVLRELEDLSYRELADIMDIPIGTVMSRLSRARQALHNALHDELTRFSASQRTKSHSTGAKDIATHEGMTADGVTKPCGRKPSIVTACGRV